MFISVMVSMQHCVHTTALEIPGNVRQTENEPWNQVVNLYMIVVYFSN